MALCLIALSLSACSRHREMPGPAWNARAAATYLDEREGAWRNWPVTAREHGTFCVSCHTTIPYVLCRPELSKKLTEPEISYEEQKVIDDVSTRVRLWDQIAPYYSDEGYWDGKPAQSRGTEAVLNAFILASNDARHGKLSDVTRAALKIMWDTQLSEGEDKGAWSWLKFGMEPWEAKDSRYYGAAVAALTTGIAPDGYSAYPQIQGNIASLSEYLNRDLEKQSLLNRVDLLWASTKLQGLITPEQQRSIVREILRNQQSDGGWELSALAWPDGWNFHSFVRRRIREDWTWQRQGSDGYATGLIAFVLQETGMSPKDPRLQRGLAWLARNQNSEDGSWPSSSLSDRRNPSSNVGHFMRDAATAYAVLALSEAGWSANSQAGKLNLSTQSVGKSATSDVHPTGQNDESYSKTE